MLATLTTRCLIAIGLCMSQSRCVAVADVSPHELRPIVLELASGARVEAQEGFIVTPRDHSDPGAGSYRQFFVRVPSRVATPRAPIVWLQGGPGGAATNAIVDSPGILDSFGVEILDIADVVGLDQRGTGGSEPRDFVLDVSYGFPVDGPLEWQEAEQCIRTACVPARAQLRERHADVAALNTMQSAHDLDVLRESLGPEKLNLIGISYGTHLALTYMRLHPDRVESAVLIGPEGPNDTFKLPSRMHRVFLEVGRQWKADPAWSGVAPDLMTLTQEALDRADAGDIMVSSPIGEIPLTRFDLELAGAYLLRNRSNMTQLPRMLHNVVQGRSDAYIDRVVPAIRRGGITRVMPLAMDLASGASESHLTRIRREAPQTPFGRAYNWEMLVLKDSLGIPDLGDGYRQPVASDARTLVIAGTLDPRTPIESVRETLERLPNGHLLTIENAGHSDDDLLWSDPRTVATVLAFLAGNDPQTEVIRLPPLQFDPPGTGD